jgi:phosphoserine phosphatase
LEAFIKKEGIHSKEVLAMADSLIDLPLLASVGHPIVVDPSKSLRKISEERHWPVL